MVGVEKARICFLLSCQAILEIWRYSFRRGNPRASV